MSRGLFISGTATDIGKTYISGLIQKKLIANNIKAAYYKPAMSGAESICKSDVSYVKSVSNSNQDLEKMVSYTFTQAVSPHLASKMNKTCIKMNKIINDYKNLEKKYDFISVEGAGGIICPFRYDDEIIMLEDIIKKLKLSLILVADAGLGTINSTVLTTSYLKNKKINCRGIIINRYSKCLLHDDNIRMIENMTKIPVIAKIPQNSDEIDLDLQDLLKLYD